MNARRTNLKSTHYRANTSKMLPLVIPTKKLDHPTQRSPEAKSTRKPYRNCAILLIACRTVATGRHTTGNPATGNHNAAPSLRVAGLWIKRRSRRTCSVIPHWHPRSRLNRHRRVDPRSTGREMAHPPVIAFPLLNPSKSAASGQSTHHPN